MASVFMARERSRAGAGIPTVSGGVCRANMRREAIGLVGVHPGSHIRNADPRERPRVAVISPPWASTMVLHSARPRPVPWALPVTSGSNTRSATRRVEAGAVVLDLQVRAGFAAPGARHDGAAPAAFEGLDGVQIQIGEHPLQQDGIAVDGQLDGHDGHVEGHVRGQDEGVARGVHELAHAGVLPAHGLAAGQAEHAANHVVGLADLGPHAVEVPLEARPVVEVAAREVEGGLGHGEGVA
jgi:hypothetical protein